MNQQQNVPQPKHRRVISFSGAGWLWYYQLGAAAALFDVGVADADNCLFVGASGGSIVATVCATKLRHVKPHRLAFEMHQEQLKDWRTLFHLDRCINNGVSQLEEDVCSDAKWAERLQENLRVYLTEVQPPFRLVERYRSRFATFQDLQESIVGSCLVPGFAGWFLRLKSSPAQTEIDASRGWDHKGTEPIIIDGGFLNLQPMQFTGGSDAIYVSPFWWQLGAQIRPRYMPTLWAMRPPQQWGQYEYLYTFGYWDALRYAVKEEIVTREAAVNLFSKRFGFLYDEVPAAQPIALFHMSRTCLGLGAVWYLRSLMRRR